MKYLIITVIIILLFLSVLYFIIGNYFYNIALNPRTSKEFVLGEMEASEIKWFTENIDDVYLTTSNNGNLRLHAYEFLNSVQSDIWAIIVHGYYGNGRDMSYYAEQYYKRGYNVLVVDLRGHGQSQGDYIGMGWHDRLDIIDWANYLIKQNPNCKIILHGVSMGAATVMMATGENLPDNIRVAVEDCGYTADCEKQKLVVEGASHAESVGVNPVLYWKTVYEFIDKYVK